MTDAMCHRGPDATGFFTEGPASLGHLRLSIIDLSTAANQPFIDNSGRYVMVFNGEIYNYQEVKAGLSGYAFHTSSDTEVLLAAYTKLGPACLQLLRGFFALAIWDRQERELFIARDRMGVKPLYYYIDDQRCVFASEVRSILASGYVKRKADLAALADYFSYQSIGYPHSIIEGIRQLEAGSWMKIKNGVVTREVYWDVTAARNGFDITDPGRIKGKIRELMLQSVRRRLVSDVPVGAFLSGGIDSSAVVALMAEASDATPNTFTISFEEKEYDESPYADIVAKKFRTNHTTILLKPTVFLDELQAGLDAMDIPSGDGINTYVVSKAIARQGMRVALSGVGGDELFAGYPFFNSYLQLRKYGFWWGIPAGLRKGPTSLLPHRTGKQDRIRQLLRAPSAGIADFYPVFRQILTPARIGAITSLGNGALDTAMHQQLMAKKASLKHFPLLSQVSAAEYLGYTQHTLLKDTDQMSMAVSLEVREPFFDQDLVEYVLAIPDEYKKPTYPKSLLVESLKPLLPDEIVFRKKQGFVFPWNTWLRKDLYSFCDGYIRNMATRPFIHGDQLIGYWQDFLKGDQDIRWTEIWLFVVLEYWLEKNHVE
ncbi:amidotransferase 1, exosortase A system-associated [Puia dinghuensis]|uniref:asparagine synthase (glutamine-hydrolyzing) n=2 Tax=Puia dinghuensis TaxID=1792502 RepID=A0A8J2UFG8_9BACT|nr:amidotransferase 1, exosortase A system-associated [Puia dinghuensis]